MISSLLITIYSRVY